MAMEVGLRRAAREGDSEELLMLLANGADVDGGGAARDGWTPLHEASAQGHAEAAAALLRGGASPHRRTVDGCTPLHLAAVLGRATVVTMLCGAGAHIDSRTRNGMTPLHLASFYGQEACVRALLAAGANICALDRWGNVPGHFAANDAIRQLLPAPRQDGLISYCTIS